MQGFFFVESKTIALRCARYTSMCLVINTIIDFQQTLIMLSSVGFLVVGNARIHNLSAQGQMKLRIASFKKTKGEYQVV